MFGELPQFKSPAFCVFSFPNCIKSHNLPAHSAPISLIFEVLQYGNGIAVYPITFFGFNLRTDIMEGGLIAGSLRSQNAL